MPFGFIPDSAFGFAGIPIFAFAARYPTYESQGFEIKLRTEWVGSRRLWETLRFTRFRLSLSASDDTLTLEGRAEYHFLHLKDSSTPETYADRKEWFDVRTVLSRSGLIRPELPAPVDWSVVIEQLPKYLPS